MQDLSSSLSSSSASDHKEGELSDKGDQEVDVLPLDRLFPVDLFPKLLSKAIVAVELED